MYVFIGENDDCNFFMPLSIKREIFQLTFSRSAAFFSFKEKLKAPVSNYLYNNRTKALKYNYTIYKFQFTVSILQTDIFI
jgi:hypothetical protein